MTASPPVPAGWPLRTNCRTPVRTYGLLAEREQSLVEPVPGSEDVPGRYQVPGAWEGVCRASEVPRRGKQVQDACVSHRLAPYVAGTPSGQGLPGDTGKQPQQWQPRFASRAPGADVAHLAMGIASTGQDSRTQDIGTGAVLRKARGWRRRITIDQSWPLSKEKPRWPCDQRGLKLVALHGFEPRTCGL